MAQSHQLKLSSFYGNNIARPYIVLDGETGESVKDRVDAPRVNDALLDWASKTTFAAGGALQKPAAVEPEGAGLQQQPRKDFAIFLEERRSDIVGSNAELLVSDDNRTFVDTAAIYWREELSAEERAAYKKRATEEKEAYAAALAAEEASNPRFKTFRDKLARYSAAVRGIASAAQAQAAPLWKLQRRMNRKYKALRGGEAQESESEEEEFDEEEGDAEMERRMEREMAKKERKAQREEAEPESDSDAEEESAEEPAAKGGKKKAAAAAPKPDPRKKKAAAEANAADALAGLKLASAPKGAAAKKAKAQPSAKKEAGPTPRATRHSEMYDGSFELPDSQASPPRTRTRGGAAAPPAKSPAPRLRKQASALPEASPAKKRRGAK